MAAQTDEGLSRVGSCHDDFSLCANMVCRKGVNPVSFLIPVLNTIKMQRFATFFHQIGLERLKENQRGGVFSWPLSLTVNTTFLSGRLRSSTGRDRLNSFLSDSSAIEQVFIPTAG